MIFKVNAREFYINARKYKKEKMEKAFEKSKNFPGKRRPEQTLKVYESSLSL